MRRGFTIVELLVVTTILAVLAAIVMAIVGTAKGSAARAVCISNVKQLAAGVQIYMDTNGGGLAHSNQERSWQEAIGVTDLICPVLEPISFANVPGHNDDLGGYAQNDCAHTMLPATDPAKLVLITESARFSKADPRFVVPYEQHHLTGPDVFECGPSSYIATVEGYTPIGDFGAERHSGGSIYGFMDGHADWLRPDELRLPEQGYGCVHNSKIRFNWRGPESGPFFAKEDK